MAGPTGRPNLAELLWDAGARWGKRPAVVERGRTTSYAELSGRAGTIASALGKNGAGIGEGERVAVLLDGGAEAVSAYFGVLAAGGVAVLVNEQLRPRQIEHVLSTTGASLLLTSGDLLARQPRPLAGSTPILMVEELVAAAAQDTLPVRRVESDPAQIVFTSGSTGLPKGVVFSHANLWAATLTVADYLGLRAEDRIASVLPFNFVYGLSQLLCAVATGATLVVERSPLIQDLIAGLRDREVTVLAAVPPLWGQLLRTPAFKDQVLPSLRLVTNAGGHLPVWLVRALRQAQPQAALFLMYGLTEALRCAYLPSEEVDRRPDSMGRAIPGAEVMVLREDLSPCETDEVGELVFRGPTVALGYWRDPAATARVFRPNPLGGSMKERVVFSGDLVRRDAAGFLYFVGRRDRMIKTQGFRVGPDEVANVLHASEQIADCVVVGEPDEQRGQRIVAHVVLAPGGSLAQLKEYCRTELPRYMQPVRYDVWPALPRLPNGKHDIGALLEQLRPVLTPS